MRFVLPPGEFAFGEAESSEICAIGKHHAAIAVSMHDQASLRIEKIAISPRTVGNLPLQIVQTLQFIVAVAAVRRCACAKILQRVAEPCSSRCPARMRSVHGAITIAALRLFIGFVHALKPSSKRPRLWRARMRRPKRLPL